MHLIRLLSPRRDAAWLLSCTVVAGILVLAAVAAAQQPTQRELEEAARRTGGDPAELLR